MSWSLLAKARVLSEQEQFSEAISYYARKYRILLRTSLTVCMKQHGHLLNKSNGKKR